MRRGLIQIACAIAASCALASCTTTVFLTPKAQQDQIVRYRDGKPTVISAQRFRVFAIAEYPRSEFDGRMVFTVGFLNTSAAPVDFSTDNVSFAVDGKAMRVFSYDELVEEQQSKHRRQEIALAIGAAGRGLAASQAGNSYSSGTVSTYTPNGPAFGTYSGSTYNPAAAQAAEAQASAETNAEAQAINEENSAVLGLLAARTLKRNTVLPGQTVSGGVEVEIARPTSDAQDALLTVSVGGETHVFDFIYTKDKPGMVPVELGSMPVQPISPVPPSAPFAAPQAAPVRAPGCTDEEIAQEQALKLSVTMNGFQFRGRCVE